MDKVTDINQIKMAVLKKVVEYAYEGTLDDKADDIPYELAPGIKPKFRCCTYREREIFRQRVRLSMGKLPTNPHYKKTNLTQVVHVISAACEGCPIERFTVTSNCHNCLAQKCIQACNFGAITKTPQGAVIDKTKCKKCGKCVEACPYSAIVDIERPCLKTCPVGAITIDADDLAYIDDEKCINCGQCVLGCPFGAISDVSMISNVIDIIRKDNSNCYAMIAPAIEGQFGDYPISVYKEAIRQLGFKDCYEVALGADVVAYREAEEVINNIQNGKKTTTSCCPAFVNLIEKHFPELKGNISTTVSPMVATARFIREMDEDATIVFIGPCIAKKNEALSHYIDEVNFVLTFEELQAMFEVKGVSFREIENKESATKYGKGFARAGGVTNAVLKVIEEKELDFKLCASKCAGVAECKKALLMLKNGKLQEDFIEGMACENGCVNGPGKAKYLNETKKIFDKYADNQNTEIIKNSQDKKIDEINIHKH